MFVRHGLLRPTLPTLAVLAGLLITACGSSPTPGPIDANHVAAAITAAVHRERHKIAAVTCPAGIERRRGLRFYCVAQIGSEVTPFRVTETDSSGDVSFVGVSTADTPQLPTSAIAAALADVIRKSGTRRPVVRCPSGIPRQRGLSFVCSAAGPGHTVALLEVRQLNGDGRFTYHYLRKSH
jgi:hypothetical protein